MYERILTDFNIRTIMDSGQVFRIRPLSPEEPAPPAASDSVRSGLSGSALPAAADGSFSADGTFLAAAGGHAVLIRQEAEPTGRMRVSFSCTEQEFKDFWNDYFDLNRDYGAIRRSVDPDDAFLTSAVRFGYGIRILRQDLWETIISFLISQNNNITRIRRSLEALCGRFGEKIPAERISDPLFSGENGSKEKPSETAGRANSLPPTASLCAFPTPEAILAGGPGGLEGLGLGYRDKYILRMAQRCAGHEGRQWLASLQKSSYADAAALLQKEYGIGKKVSDCICLFALHHVDAFPIDTHMKQILAAFYPDGFPFSRYEGYAGILQQYMFYYKLTGQPV